MTVKNNSKTKVIAASIALMITCSGASLYSMHKQSEELALMKVEIEATKQQNQAVNEQMANIDQHLNSIREESRNTQNQLSRLKDEVSRGDARAMNFVVSAYDLSEASCGKGIDSPSYGVTASGVNLRGETLYSARAIAVDPKVIPLGSKVRIKFQNDEMKRYNGIYTAVDTGGLIKGRRIDLFFGDFQSKRPNAEALAFGMQTAKVTIL